jgi:hypothetical protein
VSFRRDNSRFRFWFFKSRINLVVGRGTWEAIQLCLNMGTNGSRENIAVKSHWKRFFKIQKPIENNGLKINAIECKSSRVGRPFFKHCHVGSSSFEDCRSQRFSLRDPSECCGPGDEVRKKCFVVIWNGKRRCIW